MREKAFLGNVVFPIQPTLLSQSLDSPGQVGLKAGPLDVVVESQKGPI